MVEAADALACALRASRNASSVFTPPGLHHAYTIEEKTGDVKRRSLFDGAVPVAGLGRVRKDRAVGEVNVADDQVAQKGERIAVLELDRENQAGQRF